MWRSYRIGALLAPVGILVALTLVGAVGCNDLDARAEPGGSSESLRIDRKEGVGVDSSSEPPDQGGEDGRDDGATIVPQRRITGAAAEIDDFFFAPIGFPGISGISENCNLDDDPYGACL
jgi:hypothetical protein